MTLYLAVMAPLKNGYSESLVMAELRGRTDGNPADARGMAEKILDPLIG